MAFVIARSACDEAIHSAKSDLSSPNECIASRSLSSGAHLRDPLARNDAVGLCRDHLLLPRQRVATIKNDGDRLT